MAQQSNDAPGLPSELIAKLAAAAESAARNAYAPYSHFSVGAALLLESNEIVAGANVENASYRLTVCAEQAAIVNAVYAYGPDIRIRAVLVQTLNHAACQPCGACRQTIAEFASPETLIFFPAAGISSNAGSTLVRSTLAELLPAAFTLGRK